MDYQDYKKNRLANQIDWYDKRSADEKRYYYWTHTSQIVFATLIPVFTGFITEYSFLIFIVAGLGGLIAMLEGVSSYKNFHQKWVQYRTMAQQLKKEQYLYEFGVAPYIDSESQNLKRLVNRCELLLANESTTWANLDNEISVDK